LKTALDEVFPFSVDVDVGLLVVLRISIQCATREQAKPESQLAAPGKIMIAYDDPC